MTMEYEAQKPDEKHEEKHEEKPKGSALSSISDFFGIFKNMFGCIKNAEEAYTDAPAQVTQSLHMPTQVRFLSFC
jgi:hypothetical protein